MGIVGKVKNGGSWRSLISGDDDSIAGNAAAVAGLLASGIIMASTFFLLVLQL